MPPIVGTCPVVCGASSMTDMTPADPVTRAFHAHLPPGRSLGDNTNFFEAGFTSVRLTAVLAELAEQEIGLGLVDLFRFPTLRDLTTELRRRGVRVTTPTAAPLQAHRLPWEE